MTATPRRDHLLAFHQILSEASATAEQLLGYLVETSDVDSYLDHFTTALVDAGFMDEGPEATLQALAHAAAFQMAFHKTFGEHCALVDQLNHNLSIS